jgi:hypothetical protein
MTARHPGSVNRVLDCGVHCYSIPGEKGLGPADKTLRALSVQMGNAVIRRIGIQTEALPIVFRSGCTFTGQPHLFFG